MQPKWIVFFTVLSSWMGIAVINPLIGPVGRTMGLTEIQAGWLVTVTGVMVIVGSLYLGRKSDVLGRKKVLIIGMVGFTITLFLFAAGIFIGQEKLLTVWGIFLLLLIIRMIQGLFFGAIPSTAQAYMADITTGKERTGAMSLLGGANGLGFVFGPMLGALTAGIHITIPFFATALLTGIIAIYLQISLPNKEKKTIAIPNSDQGKNILLSKVWLPLTVSFLLAVALSTMQITSGFYIQDILSLTTKDTTHYVGIFISLAGISMVFAQLLVNRFSWSPHRLMSIGLPVSCVGFLLLCTSNDIVLLSVSFIVIGLGIGLALPGAISAASLLVDVQQQGKMGGMITASNAIGAIIAPIFGTYLYRLSPQTPYYYCVVVLFIACLLVWALGRKIFTPKNVTV
jgi:MFS family permease